MISFIFSVASSGHAKHILLRELWQADVYVPKMWIFEYVCKKLSSGVTVLGKSLSQTVRSKVQISIIQFSSK